MLNFQILSEASGKILAVLSYCTLAHAQRIAAEYERILGVPVYRTTICAMRAPQVGTVLPELVRGSAADSKRLAARLRCASRL